MLEGVFPFSTTSNSNDLKSKYLLSITDTWYSPYSWITFISHYIHALRKNICRHCEGECSWYGISRHKQEHKYPLLFWHVFLPSVIEGEKRQSTSWTPLRLDRLESHLGLLLHIRSPGWQWLIPLPLSLSTGHRGCPTWQRTAWDGHLCPAVL